MKASDLPKLAAPFPPSDVEWKPGATTRDKTKGLAMAYLTSRAVQSRLDDVCGPGDWRNEFVSAPDGGVLCGISIRIEREDGAEWVTKWDGAENSQVEAVKGGLSGAMKRCAVQWGIGRYLYDLPATWVRLDERGRFAEAPQIPRAFLPSGPASDGRGERVGNTNGADYGAKLAELQGWAAGDRNADEVARALATVAKWPMPFRAEAEETLNAQFPSAA